MPRAKSLSVTEEAAIGLFFIQRYRFLTIDQFARIAGLNRITASHQLRFFELAGMLDHFGNVPRGGQGRTPKVYFLTRKGFDLLAAESAIPADLLGTYKEVKVEAAWSPQMYHRLRTVDTLLSAEMAIRKRPHLSMVKTLLEYCRRRRGNFIVRETTDFVDSQETAENKIIPDAAMIIENTKTGRRALFFLEMDMATERIVSFLLRNRTASLHYKFEQYDRYLQSMRYSQTYAEYGEFHSFTLLFVTLNETRIDHIRRELCDLPEDFSAFYRLTTFPAAMGDFLGAIWQSRLFSDTTAYPLVREEVTGSG